ncbi:MAG: glycosyltransferase [Metallosphaera prunae]|uniref:glycosyltransferase n=1 Tax=Metallosphaera prunae TaxID=47304 RepID=UPI002272FFFE|nr:glycosyltransferase [Metallosphaera prunae]MCY0863308.1 glycosyltransferase [Metallosphaera prunae]
MRVGLVTFSLTNLREGGAERHVREFVNIAKTRFELVLFPTLNTYLQVEDEEDRNALIKKAQELEKEGITLASEFYSLVDHSITRKEYLLNFVDFGLLHKLSRAYHSNLNKVDFLFSPNFISPDVVVMAKHSGKGYGILINGYIAPLHMDSLSYSIYKSRIGQEGFLTSLPKNLVISIYWNRAVRLMRTYPPRFVAGVNRATIEDKIGALPTKYVVLDPGFAIDPSITRYRSKAKENYALFAAARLEPSKGIFDLVKIMKYLRHTDIRVKIMGKFKFNPVRFYRLAERYGVRDKIEYLGFISGEEKYKVISSARVMIYPSHDDINALTILESLAVDTPVIAYSIPGLRYAYDGTPGVTLVKEFDYKTMARETNKAMNTPYSFNSEKLEKFISHHSSWYKVVEQEMDLIMGHDT